MSNKNRKINLQLNSIFVLESLDKDETKTGKILYDEILLGLEDTLPSFKDKIFYQHLDCKQSFIEYLRYIENKVEKKYYHPIIHIECHGSDDKKGIILSPNSEFISWFEIGEILRRINIKMKNTLVLTLGVCHGINLQEIIEIEKRAPFFALIAPSNEICTSEILKGFLLFYSYLGGYTDFMLGINKIKENPKFRLVGPEVTLKFILTYLNETFDPLTLLRQLELEAQNRKQPFNKGLILSIIKKDKKEMIMKIYSNFLMLDLYPQTRYRYSTLRECLKE